MMSHHHLSNVLPYLHVGPGDNEIMRITTPNTTTTMMIMITMTTKHDGDEEEIIIITTMNTTTGIIMNSMTWGTTVVRKMDF